MTYYELLEVSENASKEVIHMAYKALCKKYHPDIFKGDKTFAEEQMKRINIAYSVLSDDSKRMKYDSFIKGRTGNTQDEDSNNQQEIKSTKKQRSLKTPPSAIKSVIIIVVLSFVSFAQVLHPYIVSDELYKYALGYGLRDFVLLNIIMLVVPLFVFSFRKINEIKSVKYLCLFNSIGVWILSLILYVCEITVSMSIGWIMAIAHYFINKHLLLQLVKREYSKKKKVVLSSIISVTLLVMVIVGTLLMNSVHTNNSNSIINYNTKITVDSKLRGDYDDPVEKWYYGIKDKSDFLDEHIVFVIEDFDNHYYTYNQMICVKKQMDEYEFCAYNKEQAIGLGYVESDINAPDGTPTIKRDFLDDNIVFVIDGFGDYYYTYDEMVYATKHLEDFEFLAYNKELALSLGYKHQ